MHARFDLAQTTDPADVKALRADGYRPYATVPGEDGAPATVYLQRPAAVPEASPQAASSKTTSSETVSAETSPASTAPVSSLGLGPRADRAFRDAGYLSAVAVLAIPGDELAAIPGVGPATIRKIDALR